MSLVLLCTTVAIVALYLLHRWMSERPVGMAADTKVSSLDWLTSLEHQPLLVKAQNPKSSGGWQATVVSGLTAAESVLDTLEAEGYSERELITIGDGRFEVRWR